MQRAKRGGNVRAAGINAALKAAAAAAAAASKPAPAVTAAKVAKGDKEPEKASSNAITPAKPPKGGGPGVTEDKLGMTLDDVIKTQDTKKAAGGGGGRAKAREAAPGNKPKGVTEDKLGMTLDDVIKTQDTKKKPAETADGKGAAGRALRGRGGIRERLQARQQRQVMRVRQQTMKQAAPKTQTVRRVRGRGAVTLDREDMWEGGVRSARAWDAPTNGEKGAKGAGRRRAVIEDWGPPPAKRARVDDWGDSWGMGGKGGKGRKGGGKGDAYGDDGWGYGASTWSKGGGKGWGERPDAWSPWMRPERRPEPMLQWDRAPAAPPVTRVLSTPAAATSRLARATEREERVERAERIERVERVEKAPERTARKSIRVCNVPKNLDDRDIQEAFDDIGRVTKCEVERGVAVITFANSAHAKKAVQTFDRGELNGQTIYVSLHDA
mmetsp:Transcript_52474/g.122436  ORF Transcript_52474/g.122436 Transcript_52474/m.122436 type:complete len:439 (+) Transcript_52474:78-1394(+)